MARGETPEDLAIRVRNPRFERKVEARRWWLNGDPVATAFYNALSIVFPKGEGFLIASVRPFRADAPPRLRADIDGFIHQEATHTREHAAFNSFVAACGYDVAPIEAGVDRAIARAHGRSALANLCSTMAIEHFTAMLGHELLRNPRHLAGGDPHPASLWRWHAIEEVEHKAVAFDTWRWATRDWGRTRRWLFKTALFLEQTFWFSIDRTAGILELMRQDGIRGPRACAKLFWFAYVNPGVVRRISGVWVRFMLPGFHPWNHDDRHLIEAGDRSEPLPAS